MTTPFKQTLRLNNFHTKYRDVIFKIKDRLNNFHTMYRDVIFKIKDIVHLLLAPLILVRFTRLMVSKLRIQATF
jgi:hypothetical protein